MSYSQKRISRQLAKATRKTAVQLQAKKIIDKQRYQRIIQREVNRQTFWSRTGVSLARGAGRSTVGFFSALIPFVVAIFVCRSMFVPDSGGFNPYTLFEEVMISFGNHSFDTSFLMTTIENFSKIDSWSVSYKGWTEAVIVICEVIVSAGNLLLMIIALLMQAFSLIGFVFELLFV